MKKYTSKIDDNMLEYYLTKERFFKMNKFTSKIDGINKLELQNLKKRLDQVFIELTKLHSDSKKLGIDNLNLLKAKNLIDDTLDDIDLSIKILK